MTDNSNHDTVDRKTLMQQSLMDILALVSEGNPGALTVLVNICKHRVDAADIIAQIVAMNMRGSSIWLGFKDFAGENLDVFCDAVLHNDATMITKIIQNGGHAEVAKQ